MEEIKLSGNEWAVDENCIVHGAGVQLQISIKNNLKDKLKLEPRDIIKIYVKKVGHKEEPSREIKNKFKERYEAHFKKKEEI